MRKVGLILITLVSVVAALFLYLVWVNQPPIYPKPAYHPPKDNAWSYYEKALKMPGVPVHLCSCPTCNHDDDCKPNPPANVKRMEMIQHGFGKPCVLPPASFLFPTNYGKVPDALCREMLQIFAREGNSYVKKEQWAEAADTYLDGMYFAADIGRDGFLKHMLTSSSESMCRRGLQDKVASHLNEMECDNALRRLSEIRKRRAKLTELICDEKIDTREIWGFLPVKGLKGIPQVLDPQGSRGFSVDGQKVGVPGWLRYTAASKKRAAVKVDEYFCKLSAESTKPFCSLRMPEVPNDLAVRSIALSKDFSSIHRRYVFNYNRVQALDRMLSVQLALRVYHLRNRSYPEKLSLKLSPHLMKTDLIDPFTGRTFRYHIKGDSFVLYSVGPDGKDDKGKPMPTGKKLQEKGDLICYGM